MAAFVGFGVQSNTYFPWAISGDTMFADIYAAGGPGAQWDALSTTAKLQIFTFIFIMELIGESSYAMEKCGQTHYMKGGKVRPSHPLLSASSRHGRSARAVVCAQRDTQQPRR
jgi:hypothetical protein